MKIIDEKGILFGKINVIDFLVVIFFLALIPMFYFGYKLYTKRKVAPPVIAPEVWADVEIYCRLSNCLI